MNSLLNTSSQQMVGFQSHYNTNGHFQQMYNSQPVQRPSFGIQEILGLTASSCRQQNINPDMMDLQGMGQTMYIPGLNSGTLTGAVNTELQQQNYFREQSVPQTTTNSSFSPWRVESLSQCTQSANSAVIAHNQGLPRYCDSMGYGMKAPSLEDSKYKLQNIYWKQTKYTVKEERL